MLRRLIAWKYLIGVAVVFGFAIYVSQQYQSASQQCEAKATKVNPRNASPLPRGEDAEKCKEDAERNFPRWYRLFSWPEGIGTWAILLTLLTIAEQAHQTRRAADAGLEAANAAYGSVSFAEAQWELMREKERARLDVDVNRGGPIIESEGSDLRHPIATLKVRNIGASRAFIRRTSGVLITKAPDATLEEPEDDYSPLSLPDHFLDPDVPPIEVPIYLIPDNNMEIQTFAKHLEESKISLHLFGFIEYETLGLRWRKDFGYDWTLVDSRSPLGVPIEWMDFADYPVSQTPKERIIYGYWFPNEERNKPEYPVSDQPQNPMFQMPGNRKTYVVTCKRCRRDVPSGVSEFPFQSITVECPLCGELRRYLPSEVSLGRPDQLVVHQSQTRGQ